MLRCSTKFKLHHLGAPSPSTTYLPKMWATLTHEWEGIRKARSLQNASQGWREESRPTSRASVTIGSLLLWFSPIRFSFSSVVLAHWLYQRRHNGHTNFNGLEQKQEQERLKEEDTKKWNSRYIIFLPRKQADMWFILEELCIYQKCDLLYQIEHKLCFTRLGLSKKEANEIRHFLHLHLKCVVFLLRTISLADMRHVSSITSPQRPTANWKWSVIPL